MKLAKPIVIGGYALAGAVAAYLIAVWLHGYFYSPFEAGERVFDGAGGTRYVMLCGAAFGAVVGVFRP